MDNTKEKITENVDVKQETPVVEPEVEEEQNTFDDGDDFYKASVEDPEVEIITDVEVDKEEGAE
jgi:hypothetical protein